ncbi:MAG: Gmad2 immunoglobulin-like domain-containing protein [Nocardioidaceae bacterium]
MNDDRTPDVELRELLEDAVSDVQPLGGIERIRARTTHPAGPARSWLWATGATVLATAATILAVVLVNNVGPGTGAGPGLTRLNPTSRPVESAGAVPTLTGASVPVYYVGDTSAGPRLYREFHPIYSDQTRAVAAVQDAMRVLSYDRDYYSPWSDAGSPTVSSVHDANGVITVDLVTYQNLQPAAGVAGAQARMALQQVVYTAQAAVRSGDPVRFLVNHHPVQRLFGVPAGRPVAAGSAAATLAPVWILAPTEHAKVPPRFTVHGLAVATGGGVVWQLRQRGRTVRQGSAATTRSGVMSSYAFTVSAPPGAYSLVVRDTTPAVGQDTKQVTVSG